MAELIIGGVIGLVLGAFLVIFVRWTTTPPLDISDPRPGLLDVVRRNEELKRQMNTDPQDIVELDSGQPIERMPGDERRARALLAATTLESGRGSAQQYVVNLAKRFEDYIRSGN